MPNLKEQIPHLLGPMLLATLINCGFFGVICVQVHTYYVTSPNDRMVFKFLVYGCFALEILQTILITRDGFDLFVIHLGDFLAIDQARFYWFSTAVIGGIVAAIGQIFFAYRLMAISKSWVLPISIVLLAICATTAQFVIAVQLFISGKISSVYENSFIPSVVAFSTSLVCDLEIVVAIVYYLSRHRPIFNSRLHRQIKLLIMLMIETGALIAAANTLSFILFILYKHRTYFVISYMMISKLYSNTMLLILNNRQTISGGRFDANENYGVIMWSTNLALEPSTHPKSNKGPTGARSPANDTLILREVQRDSMNLDNVEVVYAPNNSQTG